MLGSMTSVSGPSVGSLSNFARGFAQGCAACGFGIRRDESDSAFAADSAVNSAIEPIKANPAAICEVFIEWTLKREDVLCR